MDFLKRITISVLIILFFTFPSFSFAEGAQESQPTKPGEENRESEKAPPAPNQKSEESKPPTLEEMSIISTRPQELPEGVTFSTTPRSELDERPTRNFLESMKSLPGVVTQQGNGPRDFNISIRGMGAKVSFGVRNVKFYEDGILQTQSDGLSRLDLHDPWFMQSVEVLRGASSSLYGNYALGGVMFFRTRRGSDLMGTEANLTYGSFGYQKAGLAYGSNTPHDDVALFVSNVREAGYIQHSDYFTHTENLNFRFHIDDNQDIFFKAINNDLAANVPTRLTLSQYYAEPTQAGGLGTTTAVSLNQSRHDRRTILGVLYERQIDPSTVLTMENDYDVKDINQVFSQISANINPNFKHYTNLVHDGSLFSRPLRTTGGIFINYMEQEGQTFTNLNDGFGTRGVLRQNTHGEILNMGGLFRAEWDLFSSWTAAAGIGLENSKVYANVINYGASGVVAYRVDPDLAYKNSAPEISLTHHTDENSRQWLRAATGYGIPGISNLTTGLDGLPGINTSLKPQTDQTLELGSVTQIGQSVSLQLVGFLTEFKNEIITQTNPNGSYSINADRSDYNGIELGTTIKPLDGIQITGAYTYMNAHYVRFDDQYLVGGVPTLFSRDGNKIPTVAKNVLYTQVAYDHRSGVGGWVDLIWVGDYFANNANTLMAPGYTVMNANLHYAYQFSPKNVIRFIKAFVEVNNLADQVYVQSTAVVSDSTTDSNKQAFFSGNGRAVYGGITLGLF
jgi:iron complex outermembrane receptor protein